MAADAGRFSAAVACVRVRAHMRAPKRLRVRVRRHARAKVHVVVCAHAFTGCILQCAVHFVWPTLLVQGSRRCADITLHSAGPQPQNGPSLPAAAPAVSPPTFKTASNKAAYMPMTARMATVRRAATAAAQRPRIVDPASAPVAGDGLHEHGGSCLCLGMCLGMCMGLCMHLQSLCKHGSPSPFGHAHAVQHDGGAALASKLGGKRGLLDRLKIYTSSVICAMSPPTTAAGQRRSLVE